MLPEKPLFIIGTGRSGTTLLFRLLANHPDLAWPCIGHTPLPEPYDLWTKAGFHCFSRPCRDLRGIDAVPEQNRMEIQQSFAHFCEQANRTRFLTKYTGWPRLEFVRRIFPDARFIHLMRDGRAVAWSLMQQPWWHGWQGPTQWRWGQLSPEDQQIWEESDRSFYVLAGLQWKLLMHSIMASSALHPVLHLKYERLVASPEIVLSEICRFAELPTKKLGVELLKSANHKWRSIDTSEQVAFNKHLGPVLCHYGYNL